MRKVAIIIIVTIVLSAITYAGGGIVVTQGNCCGGGGGSVPYESYAFNGVNGQSNLGLGGSLNQNTSIYMGGYTYYNTSVLPSFAGGSTPLGLIEGHNINMCEKSFFKTSFNGYNYSSLTTLVDTCGGGLNSALSTGDLITGKKKQLEAKYTDSSYDELYFYMSDTYSEYDPFAIIYIDDVNLQGANRCMQRFTRANGYSGDYIDMYDNSNIKVFGISANGNIYIPLQSYDDDAAAGVGGLQTNEMYQTSATNTLGLPAGVVMIKQ